jgi:sugar phosphate isomerase/epimerase
MSSVCPGQTLGQLIATAKQYGYAGLEFRTEWGHAHGIELDASAADLSAARRALSGAGVAATCVATSVRFNAPDLEVHLKERELLRRYIELAGLIGAPFIRTFSDGLPEDDPPLRDRVLAHAAASYASVDDWAGQHGVTVLVETHTNMKGQYARKILDIATAENLGVLWHIGHHLQRGQSVDEAYSCVGGRVCHVHFSAKVGDAYVSDADNQRSFELLARDGFPGFFSVEVINPDEPEAVLAHHAERYRVFMEGARV